MAARAARDAAAPACFGRHPHPGWVAWAAGRTHEPRGSPALDSLARLVDPVFVGGGQLLLHGVSVPGPTDSGQALAPAGPWLAAPAPEQMAGSGVARAIPVGVRGAQSVGQPVVDRVAGAQLLRTGLCHRRLLP